MRNMGFWRAIARGRIREDRGAYAILFAILVIVLFAFVALVVDLGQTRAVARTNQSVADLALLSGGQLLTNPQAACNAAWKNLQHNITDVAIPDAASPCASMPTSIAGLTAA